MKQQLPLILIFIITLGGLFYFRVQEISCSIANEPCPEEITKKIEVLKNKSLFFTDFETIFLEQTTDQPIYQVENISKQLPNKLQLTLKREAVLYTIHINSESEENLQVFSFGNTGIQLPNNSDQSSLQINWKETYPPVTNGEVPNQIHTGLLSISQGLTQLNIDTAELNWNSDSEIRLRIPTKPEFIFDLETLHTQSKKIDTILSSRELSEFENSAQEIDMRFELPVLRTGE